MKKKLYDVRILHQCVQRKEYGSLKWAQNIALLRTRVSVCGDGGIDFSLCNQIENTLLNKSKTQEPFLRMGTVLFNFKQNLNWLVNPLTIKKYMKVKLNRSVP